MLDFKELERFAMGIKRGFRPSVSIKVNKSEVDLLMLVSRKPDRSFREYGRRIHLEKSSFSYIVDLLVLKELVVKVEDEEDKRRKTLRITEKGEDLVKELGKQRDDYINEVLSVLSKDEKEELEKAVATVKKLNGKIRETRHNDRRHHREEFPKGEIPPRGELHFDRMRHMKEGRPPHGKRPSKGPCGPEEE